MTAPDTDPCDPFLWLEDVMGERALAWVRQRNAESEDLLQAQPGFEALHRGQAQRSRTGCRPPHHPG